MSTIHELAESMREVDRQFQIILKRNQERAKQRYKETHEALKDLPLSSMGDQVKDWHDDKPTSADLNRREACTLAQEARYGFPADPWSWKP